MFDDTDMQFYDSIMTNLHYNDRAVDDVDDVKDTLVELFMEHTHLTDSQLDNLYDYFCRMHVHYTG